MNLFTTALHANGGGIIRPYTWEEGEEDPSVPVNYSFVGAISFGISVESRMVLIRDKWKRQQELAGGGWVKESPGE